MLFQRERGGDFSQQNYLQLVLALGKEIDLIDACVPVFLFSLSFLNGFFQHDCAFVLLQSL